MIPEQRSAFLHAACVRDPTLRSQLEELLTDAAEAHDFVDQVMGPRGSRMRQPRSGRFGDVRLGRTVALKFLPSHLGADDEAKQRFIHEAKAASALDHPNICAIHEIGETDAGPLHIAMAYYDGLTLKQKIGRGPLPVAKR
jgi:serine/threonine-protein kinase